MREISNTDNIIDSRDVIARFEELEGERDALQEAVDDARNYLEYAEAKGRSEDIITYKDSVNEAGDALVSWNDENEEEYEALKALCEDGESYASDWNYGATLIHEDYFTEYAEELCREIGDIPNDLPDYIACNIDWDGVAQDLKVDYTEVDFDGQTYLVR